MPCFKMNKKKRLALFVLVLLFFGCSTMSYHGSNSEIAAFQNHLETLKDKAPKTPLHEYEVGNLSCEGLIKLLEAAPSVAAKHFATEGDAK